MSDHLVRRAVRYYVAPGAFVAFLALGCFGGGLIIGGLGVLNWLMRHDVLTWLERGLGR
jgi:hypothetical protein